MSKQDDIWDDGYHHSYNHRDDKPTDEVTTPSFMGEGIQAPMPLEDITIQLVEEGHNLCGSGEEYIELCGNLMIAAAREIERLRGENDGIRSSLNLQHRECNAIAKRGSKARARIRELYLAIHQHRENSQQEREQTVHDVALWAEAADCTGDYLALDANGIVVASASTPKRARERAIALGVQCPSIVENERKEAKKDVEEFWWS